ncbi:MAG: hypothetical protein D6681_09350 [Calditrichaeota bacterium]|nr:MAG: hypothetical protein D6681_09350 [Calditrichota bacterium]
MLLLWGGWPISAQEQGFSRILLEISPDTVLIPPDSLHRSPLKLPHRFIVPSSEVLQLRAFKLLRNIDYRIDYREGTVQLLKTLPPVDSLRIIYRRYPFPLLTDYFHRELQPISSTDTTAEGPTRIAREARPRFLEQIDTYQSNLRKSGSIVRGIQIGSNQDLTLNSGLNLQLSGKIAPDVELVAALTDESTPIQPEGNTQNLREVDKVFVKILSPYVGGTIGDFNITYQKSLFGNLQRKLQGVTAENRFRNTRQQITFGTSRGFFHTNRFLGQEGNQGPYQLTGRNGERDIIVLAGTERVYVDGQLQVRGENNDYVIDYSQAQITFTNKRLITSENRIEVDFEYTNAFQRYGRNFLGASSRGENLGRRLTYDVRLFREWDDTRNLLEDNAPLTPEEQAALQAAGDDPFQAAVSGADSVGPGKGNYVKVDTLIDGQPMTIFRFAGFNQGDFRVRFTNVGAGRGDYRRKRTAVFEFVGKGRGDYLPVRLVPLAGDKRLGNMGLGLQLTRTWSVKGEVAVSDFDRNVFSSLDDGDNQGRAFQFSTTLQDTALRLFGRRVGDAFFTLRWTRQDSAFSPLDRPLQPEYAYKWNLQQNLLNNEESSIEARASYRPTRFLRISGNFGSLDKKSFGITSRRRSGQVELMRTVLPTLTLGGEQVTTDTRFDRSDWRRWQVTAFRRLWRLTPRYSLRQEDRTVENASTGALTGFRFRENVAGLEMDRLLGMHWRLQMEHRVDFLYDPRQRDRLRRLSTTRTYEARGDLLSRKNLQGRFSLIFRNKDFTPFFEKLPSDSMPIYQPDAQFQDTSWEDRQSHLANVELQYRNSGGSFSARWNYEVASELQAIREQVYLPVGENRGNFRFDSTLSEYVPDPQGDFILILRPTDDFRSVIRLETSLQVQYRPRSTSKTPGGFWKSLGERLSLISFIKLEEQTREQNILDIYLLNLSKFHTPGTTLRGSYTLNQDIYYNERNPIWGILLRSRYRDDIFNQFIDAGNNESRIVWERSIELRRRVWRRKLNLTGIYRHTLNKRWVAALPDRNRNVLSQAFGLRANLRPNFRWQFQLETERGLELDRNPRNRLRVNYWEAKPRISYSVGGKARATADLTFIRVEQVENPFNRPIPFEMGKGKKVGNSWLWNFRFDYFVSTNVTINVSYTGRKDAGALRTIHLGRAEVRAFF